jgi:hypothetical protein
MAEPALKPSPAGHVEIDWSAHEVLSSEAEYLPGAQGEHTASFAVAEPAQPSPAGHVEIDWSAHEV